MQLAQTLVLLPLMLALVLALAVPMLVLVLTLVLVLEGQELKTEKKMVQESHHRMQPTEEAKQLLEAVPGQEAGALVGKAYRGGELTNHSVPEGRVVHLESSPAEEGMAAYPAQGSLTAEPLPEGKEGREEQELQEPVHRWEVAQWEMEARQGMEVLRAALRQVEEPQLVGPRRFGVRRTQSAHPLQSRQERRAQVCSSHRQT